VSIAPNKYSNSINSQFDGSEFHHLHINDNHTLGLFIPGEIHRQVKHSGKTGKGIKQINKLALEWLCTQDTINGEQFNPTLKPYNYNGVPIRIHQWTSDELTVYGHTIGDPNIDTVIRELIARYKILELENELLRKKLEECEKKEE